MRHLRRPLVLSRILAISCLLAGVSMAIAGGSLIFQGVWQLTIGAFFLACLLFGVAGAAGLRGLLISSSESRFKVHKTVEETKAGIAGIEARLMKNALAIEGTDRFVREHLNDTAKADDEVLKSIGVTNRSIMRLREAVETTHLETGFTKQLDVLDKAIFNLVTSQRRLEFEVLKERGSRLAK